MAKNEVTKFLKVRDVKSPERAFPTDAGIDFFVPKFDSDFIKDLKKKNPDLFSSDCRPTAQINTGMSDSGYYVSRGSFSIGHSNQEKPSIVYKLNDKNDTQFKFDDEQGKLYFLLAPHSRVLIPSGVHVGMAVPGRALIAANKSGVANKYGLIFGAQVVDFTYRGEIHISVINTSTNVVRIYEDMKLIQFVETPVINNPIEIVECEDVSDFFIGRIKDRGDGGFGSTNK